MHLACFLLLILSCVAPSLALPGEAAPLLAQKAAFNDSVGVLGSWNGPDPCNQPAFGSGSNWVGVTCQGGAVTGLDLSKKNLFGTLSPALAGLNLLQTLDLSSNSISGPLPSEWGDGFPSLTNLILQQNLLSGTLPPSLGKLQKIQLISVGSNMFIGSLPEELGNCVNLRSLGILRNQFNGPLPTFPGRLPALTVVSFIFNNFTGSLPAEWANNTNIITLFVNNNNLTGSIPQEYGKLQNCTSWQLNDNRFTGPIPEALGNLPRLRIFNIQNNNFTGVLPKGLLRSTMTIPTNYTNNPFLTIDNSTDISPAPAADVVSSDDSSVNKGAIIGGTLGGAAGLLLVLVVGCIVLRKLRKRRKGTKEENAVKESLDALRSWRMFSLAEMKAATDNFALKKELGSGGFGSVYLGQLPGGRQVAIKRMDEASHQGTKEFAAEVETLSGLKHRNLLALRGCCVEGVERIIVYDYVPGGSLAANLHLVGGLENYSPLTFLDRLRIGLGVATGLAFLHEKSNNIVHRDVKASNVLLDNKLEAKVSDFGLAKVVEDEKTHVTTRVAGTIGYVAPEYARTGHVTPACDVYSFGILLLEIFTARKPVVRKEGGLTVTLLGAAQQAQKENMLTSLVDPYVKEYPRSIAQRVLELGLKCAELEPELRPTMEEVVKALKPLYKEAEEDFNDTSMASVPPQEVLFSSPFASDVTQPHTASTVNTGRTYTPSSSV